MAKYAADFAYLDEGQCNDHARESAVITEPRTSPARAAQGGRTPATGWTYWLRRLFDWLLALFTFGAQVAGVVLVIVLIAKYSIH